MINQINKENYMSECSKSYPPAMNDAQEKAFWGWWETNRDTTFSKADIDELLNRVKAFNAGAIDDYLTTHVDKVYTEWLVERQ